MVCLVLGSWFESDLIGNVWHPAELSALHLKRSRWMSDLVNELPESIANPTDRELLSNKKDVRTTRIVNSNGATVYQWGDNPTDDLVLAADITVSQPLNSWRLQMAVDPSIFKSQTTVGANIVLGIVASSIALIAVRLDIYS